MTLPSLAHSSWANCNAFELVPTIGKKLIPNTFIPTHRPDVFKAFSMAVDEIKVVIVGLSPYPGKFSNGNYHATGYAFAIEKADTPYEQWPASLKVIADGVAEAEGIAVEDIHKYFQPDLELWRDQGVLLINISLTSIISNSFDARAHIPIWKEFTTKLLQWLDTTLHNRIYYFMGSDAIKFSSCINPMFNHVLTGEHPAAVARAETPRKFNHCFKELKKLYKDTYKEDLSLVLPF